MTLFIDTTAEKTFIALYSGQNLIDKKAWRGQAQLSAQLLDKIENLLHKNNKNKADLSAILINPGPGSYSDLRVGITTANFLAFSLDIPVVAAKKKKRALLKSKKFTSPVMPNYSLPASGVKPH